MLSKPTILVLGAGSSSDFGLPLGDKLATQLREILSYGVNLPGPAGGDPSLVRFYSEHFPDPPTKFIKAAEEIAAALPSFKSIDDCLHTHGDDQLGVLAGKMAIARAIASAEANSSVAQLWERDPNVSGHASDEIRAGWMGTLVQLLVTGVPRRRFAEVFKDLIVISFNYDRCAESVLFKLIQRAFGIDAADAAEAMRGLTVFHPYGSLGNLDLGDGSGTPFAPSNLDLIVSADELFVYTESRDQPPEIQRIKEAVDTADRLLFLGFGFHRQNIELLVPGNPQSRHREIYGTVFKEPGPAVRAYEGRLRAKLPQSGHIELIDDNCSSFMKEFRAVFGD